MHEALTVGLTMEDDDYVDVTYNDIDTENPNCVSSISD